MEQDDIKSFLADGALIDLGSHLLFTYNIETAIDPMLAAAHLCRETSTAQWRRPGVAEDLRPRHAAKVLSTEVLGRSVLPTFPHLSSPGERCARVKVRIAHPIGNIGTGIPNLLTVAMGEGAFFCEGVHAIKLLDIDFPRSYLSHCEGPQFGTSGLRETLGISDRPLFFGVVKPNIGLDPASFAKLALDAWAGGLDVAKDDEMLANPDYSPFSERMKLVGGALKEAEQRSGMKKMFIANITDDISKLKLHHDVAISNGVNAVMVNALAVGLSSVRWLRSFSSVPIVGHFDCIAPMSRHPNFGVGSSVMTKLQRLCGCDAIIMPGFGARMMTSDDEVIANAACCSSPLGKLRSVLPVPGGSDWAGTLPMMCEKLGMVDFAICPGRGIFGHPMGAKAGAASLRQAWEAIHNGIALSEQARSCEELREAIRAFGSQG